MKNNLEVSFVRDAIEKYPGRIVGLKESSGQEESFLSFIKLQKSLEKEGINFSLFMGEATKIGWIAKEGSKYGFKLTGAVPVEANIPEKVLLYRELIHGNEPPGIEYISIPKTIEELVKMNLINQSTLEFWNL